MDAHVKEFFVPAELKALLKEYPALRVDDKKGKVCCCLTGHEMPLRKEAVHSFVTGKKFLKAQSQREYDFEQYKPHLVPNTKKGMKNTLFCTLTLRCVTKRPEDVERHVNGKRYQRALKRWQRCQETGEKFKPRGGKRRRDEPLGQFSDHSTSDGGSSGGKAKNFWQLDSDEDGDSDDDDLDDLYPSEDFASGGEGSDEENGGQPELQDRIPEFDQETPSPNLANGQSSHSAEKRKQPQKPGRKKVKV
ncbi:surfeit locus protein 2-like [Babylonia areolata]|uniref:surfeit locus protein 2-like n=1 Tax=Babylonia areolata TaxID=304850 RepID=UPI003FD60C91